MPARVTSRWPSAHPRNLAIALVTLVIQGGGSMEITVFSLMLFLNEMVCQQHNAEFRAIWSYGRSGGLQIMYFTAPKSESLEG